MPGLFKLLLAGGVLVALPYFAISTHSLDAAVSTAAGSGLDASVQDPVRVLGGREEARWNFAALTYKPVGGDKMCRLAARNLNKIQVLQGQNGQVFLEIVHRNSDYTCVQVSEFNLIRRTETWTAAEVPVVRTTLKDMGFPNFK